MSVPVEFNDNIKDTIDAIYKCDKAIKDGILKEGDCGYFKIGDWVVKISRNPGDPRTPTYGIAHTIGINKRNNMTATIQEEYEAAIENKAFETEQLKSLILEMAAENGTELTPEQITFTLTDWNELISPEGKIETDDGNEYITLAELRRLARMRGYHSSKPEVVQVPEFENAKHATVQWTIHWRDGVVDGACACASRHTVNDGFKNFTTAIASNRAEARCIRSALGISTCSYEEIGPGDDTEEYTSDVTTATDQQKSAINMLLIRNGSESGTKYVDFFGEGLLAKLPIVNGVLDIPNLTNSQAVKVMAALNKYKGKK